MRELRFNYLILILSILLINLSAKAGNICLEIFTLKISSERSIAFTKVVDTIQNVDSAKPWIARKALLEQMMDFISGPHFLKERDVLLIELKRLADLTPHKLDIEKIIEILELSKSSAADWINLYMNEARLEELYPVTDGNIIGAVLERLPEHVQNELLKGLGDNYAQKKNRDLTLAIHIILNPLKLYNSMKAAGKTDREFYIEYLARLRAKVFPTSKSAGNYSAEDVLVVAEMIRASMRDEAAYNWFGSIPNGFARNNSDLDLFNHANEKTHPQFAWQIANAASSMGRLPDPLVVFRSQIFNPSLNKQILDVFSGTRIKWRTEESTDHAHEHFGSQTHIFSFHITKDKVILRLYPHFEYNGATMTERWKYIELDLTDYSR